MFAPAALTAWDNPLTPEERERLLNKAAKIVVDRRLQTPAILALEMHKPLAFVASQALIVTTPLIGPVVGLNWMQAAGRLLNEPGGVEALIEKIESMTAERDAARGQSTKTAIEGGV